MAPTKRAFGRSLSDLWLNGEEGKLHPAEWKLLEACAQGEWCVLGEERPTAATETTRIRAELLRFIALGGDEENSLHEKGVQLSGAYIICENGRLDFEGCVIPENLTLLICTIDGEVVLNDTIAEAIGLVNSHVLGINADGCETSGSVHLSNGFLAMNPASFMGAKFGGDLVCVNGHFNGSHVGLMCDGCQVFGSVFLRDDFQSTGTVRFVNAKIEGYLDCSGGGFQHEVEALQCDGFICKGNVLLCNKFSAKGIVSFRGATIGGQINCRQGRLLGGEGSLSVSGGSVAETVFLDDGFMAFGTVDLSDTHIGHNLICNNAIFSGPNQALFAPRAKIGGKVDMGTECRVAGQVSFQGAKIGGDITFRGGSFEGKPAINLRNADIGGMLVWRDLAYVRGELNLAGASCLTLNMDKKAWDQPSEIRLDAFTYKGFSELPPGCDAQFWKDFLDRQPNKHLETRFRPNPYTQLANVLENMGHEQEALAIRIEQRRLQARFTRKYEPVVDQFSARFMRWLTVFWNFLQGALVHYGYRPGRAMLYLIGVVVAGSLIYHLAARDGIMTPTHPLIFKEAGNLFPQKCTENWVYFPEDVKPDCEAGIPSEYSEFNAIIYSLDTALPIVNLRMESDWSPRVVTTRGKRYWPGWWVRAWEWVQISLGWLLSLIFVSAVGGIIRK